VKMVKPWLARLGAAISGKWAPIGREELAYELYMVLEGATKRPGCGSDEIWCSQYFPCSDCCAEAVVDRLQELHVWEKP
jgi:hypothetical protein